MLCLCRKDNVSVSNAFTYIHIQAGVSPSSHSASICHCLCCQVSVVIIVQLGHSTIGNNLLQLLWINFICLAKVFIFWVIFQIPVTQSKRLPFSRITHLHLSHVYCNSTAFLFLLSVLMYLFDQHYLPTHCPPRSQQSTPLAAGNLAVTVRPPTRSAWHNSHNSVITVQ